MSEIALLDENTIDKIAAGEVVERPASVVKELVENSIDAGAKDITVEIRDGGITFMRVSDNGRGIPGEQLPNAFLRHYTSKITDAEDLKTVRSLGFRGEALSSVAAVSKVEILTKCADSFVGRSYRIEGGKEIENIEIGTPDGTTVFVRMLFYNTPARRKFLKSPMTEGNYITGVMEKLALSHPDISFRLLNGSKEVIHTSGNGKPVDAIYEIYGKSTAKNLLDISVQTDSFSLTGWIGKPSVGRGNRGGELFFVDGRSVKSNVVSKALEEGCRGFLMQHKFPFAVLFFSFNEAAVDVNVHPTKQEVRFLDERRVYDTVCEAVSERLRRREDIEEIRPTEEKEKRPEPDIKEQRLAEPFEARKLQAIKQEVAESIRDDTPYSRQYEYLDVRESEQVSFLSEEAKKSHRIIGQVFNVYWIVEFDNSLYIIDQHAAHEKVLYERFMRSLENHEMTSQQISPPIIVSLDPVEQSVFAKNEDVFSETGYLVEPFGGNEFAVTSVPANIVNVDIKLLFYSMIADLSAGKNSADMQLVKERIATMSCKAAVKENDRMSFAEADALIDELLKLDEPYHCPHGRPTIISMSKDRLDRFFKRVV